LCISDKQNLYPGLFNIFWFSFVVKLSKRRTASRYQRKKWREQMLKKMTRTCNSAQPSQYLMNHRLR
ncbi:unnamed protein product, partial [Brassica oleracea]